MDRLKPHTRCIWLTLEAEEIVELKQVMMDYDVEGAREFFYRVVLPRVRSAAERRGMTTEVRSEEFEEGVRASEV